MKTGFINSGTSIVLIIALFCVLKTHGKFAVSGHNDITGNGSELPAYMKGFAGLNVAS